MGRVGGGAGLNEQPPLLGTSASEIRSPLVGNGWLRDWKERTWLCLKRNIPC